MVHTTIIQSLLRSYKNSVILGPKSSFILLRYNEKVARILFKNSLPQKRESHMDMKQYEWVNDNIMTESSFFEGDPFNVRLC